MQLSDGMSLSFSEYRQEFFDSIQTLKPTTQGEHFHPLIAFDELSKKMKDPKREGHVSLSVLLTYHTAGSTVVRVQRMHTEL